MGEFILTQYGTGLILGIGQVEGRSVYLRYDPFSNRKWTASIELPVEGALFDAIMRAGGHKVGFFLAIDNHPTPEEAFQDMKRLLTS